jgi:hypothetical protein
MVAAPHRDMVGFTFLSNTFFIPVCAVFDVNSEIVAAPLRDMVG